ncbi:MAG: YdeI/OmpD-associated family protein [Flavobacteriaceae bacterium]
MRINPRKSHHHQWVFTSSTRRRRTLKEHFEQLTPYKQREYMEYIDTAKSRGNQKITRMEKIKPMILAGKGLNDQYNKKSLLKNGGFFVEVKLCFLVERCAHFH